MNNLISKEKESKKIFSTEQWLIVFFLFLGAMNFITRYYYWFFIAFFLFSFFVAKFRIDRAGFALLGLSISLLIFGPLEGSGITSILKPFIYVLCYLMGGSFLQSYKNDDDKKHNATAFSTMAIILASGLFIHLVLNLSINMGSADRNTIDFWIGEVISATGQATLACLPIAVICAILFSDNQRWKKMLAVCALIVILYYNLILAGRTAFLFVLFGAMLALIYALWGDKEHKNIFKAKLLLGIMVAILVAVILYSNNFLNIKDIVEGSNFYQRFFGKWGMDMDEDGRGDYKLIYLQNMWGHFWGGGHIHEIADGYAHDIFLDTYDQAGIFALISMIIYIITSFKNFWRCVMNRSLDFKFRQFVLCIYFICYVQFMIEPVLQAMQWLFAIFCFLDGMLRSYLDDNKRMMKHRLLEGQK